MDQISLSAVPMMPRGKIAAPSLPIGGGQQDTSAQAVHVAAEQSQQLDMQQAEQKRMEMVQRAAQHIANIYVVSDQRFTIFKDASGQFVTRFTSLRDGKVYYIPEPNMMQMMASHSDSNASTSLVV